MANKSIHLCFGIVEIQICLEGVLYKNSNSVEKNELHIICNVFVMSHTTLI